MQHLAHGGRVRLPAEYVAEHVELAYASTAHRAQGVTVDTAHPLVTNDMTRETLYVATTRARHGTTLYVATEELLGVDADTEPGPPRTAHDVFSGVLGHTGAEASATETIRNTINEAEQLPVLVARYQHALAHAAHDSLTTAAELVLSPSLAERVLTDPAAPALAHSLALAGARGYRPARILEHAARLRELHSADSTARVLAHRIDQVIDRHAATTRGLTQRPLPTLDPPDVGDPKWRDYLHERANLIQHRADTLANAATTNNDAVPHGQTGEPQHGLPARLASAYRELYGDPALDVGQRFAPRQPSNARQPVGSPQRMPVDAARHPQPRHERPSLHR